MLDNLIWHALHTEHAHLAQCAPLACKYPADVAPFAATLDNSPESLHQLHHLLAPGETVYISDERPAAIAGLEPGEAVPSLQMTAPATPAHTPTDRHPHLQPTLLSCDEADHMLSLTTLAFSGFFRRRTCLMGAYYGLYVDGQLIAMAGERLASPGGREISGVCTHPAHTGQGHAAKLIAHLLHVHAQAGLSSFLHVAGTNSRAIALYQLLGFVTRREMILYPLTRSAAPPV